MNVCVDPEEAAREGTRKRLNGTGLGTVGYATFEETLSGLSPARIDVSAGESGRGLRAHGLPNQSVSWGSF